MTSAGALLFKNYKKGALKLLLCARIFEYYIYPTSSETLSVTARCIPYRGWAHQGHNHAKAKTHVTARLRSWWCGTWHVKQSKAANTQRCGRYLMQRDHTDGQFKRLSENLETQEARKNVFLPSKGLLGLVSPANPKIFKIP